MTNHFASRTAILMIIISGVHLCAAIGQEAHLRLPIAKARTLPLPMGELVERETTQQGAARASLLLPIARTHAQDAPHASHQKAAWSVSFSQVLNDPEVLAPSADIGHETQSTAGPHLRSAAATRDLSKTPQNMDVVPFQWWNDRVRKPILEKNHWLSFDSASILLDGLTHAPRIRAVASDPLVAESDIVEADAAFDPSLLVEGLYSKISDPVGNTLVTGGSPRLREETFSYRMGLQQLNRNGGQFEATQELGLLNNNSVFLVPPNQGNSRLSLSLTQPLLAGAGNVFNERLIVQARIDNRIAWQESLDEIQARLADIYAGYWQLFELRATAIQQYDLLIRGEWVKERIEQRKVLDASQSQVVRAQAAITRRRTQMIQATARIGDQQSRLVALVGSPHLEANRHSEFIPTDLPEFVAINGTLRDAVVTGLQYHPRIHIATNELESAVLAEQVAKNQVLPLLNAVFDTYVAGLNGNNGTFDSFADQFSEGEPSFSIGLEYNRPIGNRAAQARHRRQKLVQTQQQNELREVLLEVTAEIEIAFRAMTVAKAEIEAQRHTLQAARTEEAFFANRWEHIPSEDGSATFVLEDLLDAQERRTEAERQWVSAKVRYLVSIARLQQAMGTLLMNEGVQPMRANYCDTSEIIFTKNGATGQ